MVRYSKYDFKAKKRKRGKDAHPTSDDEDQELEESVRVISDLLQRAQKGDLNSVLELGDLIGVGGVEAEPGNIGSGAGASGSGGGVSVSVSSEAAEVRSRRLGNMKADMLAALAARARQGGKAATAAAGGGGTGAGAGVRVEDEDEEEDEEEIDELEDDVEEAAVRARSRSVGGAPIGSHGASGNAAGAEAAIDDAAGAGRNGGEGGEESTGVGGKGSTTVGYALGMWDDDGDDSDAFPIPLRARKGKSGSAGGPAGPSKAPQSATTPPAVSTTESKRDEGE